MIKIITVVKRKPAMNLDAFTTHWRTTHAEAVKRVPGIRRYVQSQTIASGYRHGDPVYDGIAEIWYDDIAAARLAAATPAAALAMKDNDNFLDMKAFASIITDEVVQLDGNADPSMVKLNEFVIRKPAMDPTAFHKYWTEVHGPLGATIRQMRRYVQSHARPSSYRDGHQPFIDGVAQVWFENTAAMRESATTEEYAAVRADEPNFIDTARLSFIITQERIVIG